jgi:hypothetical protein
MRKKIEMGIKEIIIIRKRKKNKCTVLIYNNIIITLLNIFFIDAGNI